MKKIFFSCLLIFSFSAHAQITFQKTYGDTAGASGRSILVTSDGGYLISGFLGVYVPLGLNACLIKIDELGDTLWTTLFRSQDWAEVYSAASTFDGGYILTGIHRPIGYGFPNIFLVKLDLNGAIQWSKSISKTPLDVSDYGISLQQTNDSGYIVTGWTWNPTGSGSNDICLIKTDGNGNLIWFKTYGEYNSDEYGESVQQTLDGGYVLCGYTYPQPMGPGEIYLIKTDVNGDTLWTKTLGWQGQDFGHSIQQTINGGYIVTGETNNSGGAGQYDEYLINLDSNGNVLWSKIYGGIADDKAASVRQTQDGGYIIVGQTSSFGAGNKDVYLIKTDNMGDTLWTRTFGGVSDDFGTDVRQTSDGGYVIVGETGSTSAGYGKIFVIKTDSVGNSGCNEGYTNTIVSPIITQAGSFPVTVSYGGISNDFTTINGNGASVTTLCIFIGIDELSNGQHNIFLSPNPVINELIVESSGLKRKKEIEIYNMLGEKIYVEYLAADIKRTTISVTNFLPGIYFIKIRGEKGDLVAKFVKQ